MGLGYFFEWIISAFCDIIDYIVKRANGSLGEERC